MKKTICFLYTTIFMVFSLMFVRLYVECEDYYYDQYNSVWLFEVAYSEDMLLTEMRNAADNYNVNIYQYSYDISDDGVRTEIYYYILGNEKLHNHKYKTLYGYSDTFSSTTKRYFEPLTEDNYNFDLLLIQAKDSYQLEKAADYLAPDNFSIEHSKILDFTMGMAKRLIRTEFFTVSVVFILLIILLNQYQYHENRKTIALKRLLGYDYEEIKYSILIHNFKLLIFCIFIALILNLFYLYNYNQFSGIKGYLFAYVCVFSVLIFFIIVLHYLNMSLKRMNKPVSILKNKNSAKKTMILSLSFKCIFMFLLVLLFSTHLSEYIFINEISKETDNWEQMKNYVNFNYVAKLNLHENTIADDFAEGNILKNIWLEAEKNGGILINLSLYTENFGQELPYEYDRRLISVNKNYLNLVNLKDTDGNHINLDNLKDDKYNLLVPEKYKDYEQRLVSDWQDYCNNMYSIVEKIYYESLGEVFIPDRYIPLEITYIQDGQSVFLYDLNHETENSFKATDPYLLVVNGDILGINMINSYISKHSFKGFISGKDYSQKDIEENLVVYGADKFIKTYNSYNHSIANDILMAESKRLNTGLSLSLLLLTEIITTIIFCRIYLDTNRKSIAVKKSLGYTYSSLYGIMYALILLTNLFVFFILLFWRIYNLSSIIFMFLTIDMVLSYLCAKGVHKHNITYYLKGK